MLRYLLTIGVAYACQVFGYTLVPTIIITTVYVVMAESTAIYINKETKAG